MKIAKLSLATIVALGAMTTIASASPLEEAIKGVELNGYVRYRFTDDSKTGVKDHHKYNVVTDFVVPVTDGVKAQVAFTASGANTGEQASATQVPLHIDWANFQFVGEGYSVKLGKQGLETPWTDGGYMGDVGDGLFALYTGVPSWTFGAGAFVNTNKAADENLYALGAIGAIDPVSIQLWVARLTHVISHSVYLDVAFEMAGFSAELQANNLKLQDGDTGTYFGGKLGYSVDGFSAEVGVTKDSEKGNARALGDDSFISFGEQLGAGADSVLAYIDLGYKIDKFAVGLGYGQVDTDGAKDNEVLLTAKYNWSKNFYLSSYYSSFNPDGDDNTNNEIRFEAKYSF